jgi:anti-anti-sigma factor
VTSVGPVTEEIDAASGAVIRLSGDVDHASAPALCAAIERATAAAPQAPIMIDLTGVESCDPRCVVALINAAREVRPPVSVVPGTSPVGEQLVRAGALEFLRLAPAPG